MHEKLRAAVVDGTAILESVTSLMQARAALELSYSKSLQKLSQHPFAFNGAMLGEAFWCRADNAMGGCRQPFPPSAERTIHPAVFEAIASLRGDIANEGVQHLELANSIQKEVIEPLTRVNDRTDTVQRIVRRRRHGLLATVHLQTLNTRYRCRAPRRSASPRRSGLRTTVATSSRPSTSPSTSAQASSALPRGSGRRRSGCRRTCRDPSTRRRPPPRR